MIRILLGLFSLWVSAATAQMLDFPSNASLQEQVETGIASYDMPVGIWIDGVVPTETVEGALIQQAWRIEAAALTTLQLVRPLREQLLNDRFKLIFECQTEACGGFDFRFGVETLGPPQMQINLGDFRYLAARRFGEDGPVYIGLFVSRTSRAGFIQVTRIGPEVEAELVQPSAPAVRAASTQPQTNLEEALATDGHTVLPDLTFPSGSSQLGEGVFESLQEIADYLVAFPDRTVALVGHTDSKGSLDANIALSKRRAASVLERLVSDYGVSRRQLAAEGMGYLSPISTNLTEEGREANRRVEVIVTSTDGG